MNLFQSRKKLFAAIFFAVVLLALNSIPEKARAAAWDVVSPVVQGVWNQSARFSSAIFAFGQDETMRQEIDRLTRENVELRNRIAQLQDTERENIQLRQAFNLGIQEEFQVAEVNVIAKEVDGDVLIVRKIGDAELSVDMPVMTHQKVAVGKVISAEGEFARIMLLSYNDNSVPAKIPDRDVTAVVRGGGSFETMLDRVPQEKELFEGDSILTSSRGGIFPENLLIGKVGRIQQIDAAPYQTAEIVPFVHIQDLEQLFIVLNY